LSIGLPGSGEVGPVTVVGGPSVGELDHAVPSPN
jgi:hypothetical protein